MARPEVDFDEFLASIGHPPSDEEVLRPGAPDEIPAQPAAIDPWEGDAQPARHRGAGREYQGYSNEDGELLGVPYDYERSPSKELEDFQAFLRQPRKSAAASNANEQDYLMGHGRPRETHWSTRTLMTPGDQIADRDSISRANAHYEEGLEGARNKDRGEVLLVDKNPGMATMMVRSGIPQETVQSMTVGQAQELQKWLMSGGQYLGGKNRGQDMDMTKFLLKELAGIRGGDVKVNAGMQETQLTEAGKDRRATATQKKTGGGGAGGGPGRSDALAAWLAQQVSARVGDMTMDQAKGMVSGDESAVPQNLLEGARQALAQFKGLPFKEQNKALNASLNREGMNQDQPVRSASAQQLAPKERLKIREEYSAMDRDANDAKAAWNTLGANPDALKMVVRLGLQGKFGDVTDASLDPNEQQAASTILRVISDYAFSRGGKSLTGNERQMLESGTGTSLGSTQVFKSPQVMLQFIKHLGKVRNERKQNISTEYGSDFFGGQNGAP